MKKKRIFWITAGIILFLVLVLWIVFLRPTRPVVSAVERMAAGEEDTSTLIVVYSYSGNTRRVAQILQDVTGGDLLEINTRRDYVGGMATMAAQTRIERATGLLPSLDVELPDIGKYDRILIGGPVWSYTTATPIARFLSDMDFTGKQVAPFWTDAGSPGEYESTAGDVEVLITLNDSKAAADLVAMLPLEMELIERNSFAKGMTLPAHLSNVEDTTREYEIGDFGYWDAGPDLAIFYDDIYEQTIVDVIPLGHAETGAEAMANCTGKVRLELVTE